MRRSFSGGILGRSGMSGPLLAGVLAALGCGGGHDRTLVEPLLGAGGSSGEGQGGEEPAAPLPVPLSEERYVTFEPGEESFAIVAEGGAAVLWVSASDHPGVARVTRDLQADVERVTGTAPEIVVDAVPSARDVVIVGTIGRSPVVDRLIAEGKLDVTDVEGRWETSLAQVVSAPWEGVERALVLAGSDPRGTIFAAYELSRQMGVSPWYYWDDVPATQRDAVYARPGRFSRGEPAVKYRGFFINDEAPQLSTWANRTFGPAPNPRASYGFNAQLYAKVYEVLLRLGGNYLWPAVWGRSLFDDDPANMTLAAEYGIVVGTSHEAPMMRAQDEWNRFGTASGPYAGTGEFSFVRNPEPIKEYWRGGFRRFLDNGFEGLVTVGMRGNGDTGLEDAAGIELMDSIVAAQRQIIAEETGQDPASIPQVWTLYKEVQRYWDEGMRGPDDVTIIWCDDNWGNMRGLPNQADPPRPGGYGLYYHFDYVGGGRNYKWVDTSLLPNVWEQLHLSFEYGIDRVWMVNVGDLKNSEQPLQFFIDYAWDPEALPIERLPEWEAQWAEQQFGPDHAGDIAAVLARYHQLQARRKPELLNRRITLASGVDIRANPAGAVVYTDESPYSLVHYEEAERVVEEWKALAADAEAINADLPEAWRDAFYQLVLYQVAATANVYELRLAQFANIRYAAQGRAATGDMAAEAEARYAEDEAMSAYYNGELAGGKWSGWQTQPKLGYGGPYPNSSWQQPEENYQPYDFIWPELVSVEVPAGAELGVAVSGDEGFFPAAATLALPVLSPYQSQPDPYIELFNRGQEAFEFTIAPSVEWLTVSPSSGTVTKQTRARVSVDWARAPAGPSTVPITVTGPNGTSMVVQASIDNPAPSRTLSGFVEANGYVSIEAEHFDRSVELASVSWKLIPGIGRTGSGLTPFPVTAPRQDPVQGSPRLEYDVELFTSGPVTVWAYLSPRLPIQPTDGLKYAVSIDDAAPQIVNTTTTLNSLPDNKSWERNTSDNVNLTSTSHVISEPGRHVLKFWMVDPAVVVQKLVIDTGGLRPSYLGPPESFRAAAPSPQ